MNFVSNNTNSDTDFSFSLSTPTHEDVPNRTDIEERVSLRYKSGIASPPLQLVRRKLPWTRERERPAIVLPLEGRGGCLWSRVRELELGRNVVVMTGKRSRIDDREGRRR